MPAATRAGKAGLLLWCQRSTKGYAGVDITNFTSSWNDGLAFCAIINRFRPDLLEFEGLSKENALENLELAFKVAEEKLNISRFLDPEDVANVPRPDEKSIIAYVSQFFKLFAGAAKNDALIKSIERAVAVTREHDRLAEEYAAGGTALAASIAARTAALRESNADDSTAKVKEAYSGFTKYINEERPALLANRVELEGSYNVLRSSKRNNKRPEFVPLAEVSPDGLGAAWAVLEEVEQAHERGLIDKYARFQKVDLAASRFSNKASTVEEWLNERVVKFQGGEHGASVQECKWRPRRHTDRACSRARACQSKHEHAGQAATTRACLLRARRTRAMTPFPFRARRQVEALRAQPLRDAAGPVQGARRRAAQACCRGGRGG